MAQREVRTGDRTLTVYDEGDPSGPAVLVHHGTPGAGPPYAEWVQDASARGLRFVAYDRPGYGSSTPAPGRTIADAAQDAAAIMDALGVREFATWGVSGGGPHALACAALLGDRVTAACTIGGVAPFDAAGLNYFRGMGEDNIVEFGLAMGGREHITPFISDAAAGMLGNLADLAASIQTLVAAPDQVALGGPLGAWWAESLKASFSVSPQGWIEDELAFVQPFGFDIAAISLPMLIVHGHLDQFVPLSHGEWLAHTVPGAHSWLLEDEAHLSLLINQVGNVHEWLRGHFND